MDLKIKIYAGRIRCIKDFGRMIIPRTELDRNLRRRDTV
jgi:hypothetical protein